MHAYIKGPLSQCENVSKTIRKKDYNKHVRLNGLATDYVSKGNNKVMANQNDGHPSYDHGLKHSTSLADPH